MLLFSTYVVPTDVFTLSLHDALPISKAAPHSGSPTRWPSASSCFLRSLQLMQRRPEVPVVCRNSIDRKSTRLNSSHLGISYAVFCLKKKTNTASWHLSRR